MYKFILNKAVSKLIINLILGQFYLLLKTIQDILKPILIFI